MFHYPTNRTDISRYFTQTLNFPDTGIYKTLNLDVNSKWNWSSIQGDNGYSTVVPGITKAMQEQKNLRSFVAGGFYDLATPVFAAKYVLGHMDIPENRVEYSFFPTGHSIFDNEEQLAILAGQVRSFVRNERPLKPDQAKAFVFDFPFFF
jgi:carboxypeptidase C (cathepsin A)